MYSFLKGQTAVVTGAGGTIGSEIARSLAKNGANVVLMGRTLEKLEKVKKEIEEDGGTAMAYACDMTDEKAVTEASKKITSELGVCRFLINCAGGNNIKAMTTLTKFADEEISDDCPEGTVGFFNVDMEAYRSVLDINIMGTVIPSKVFGAQMAKEKKGSILNFASMNTYTPLTRVAPYAMSKAAIANFTKWLGAYLAPSKIRVNAVAPGFFVNERSVQYLGTVENGLTERGKNVINHTPAGDFGKAKQLVGCVMWLLNDETAEFVTGITVPVDGGFLSTTGV